MLKLQRERERERERGGQALRNLSSMRSQKGGRRHRPIGSRLIKGVAYGDL